MDGTFADGRSLGYQQVVAYEDKHQICFEALVGSAQVRNHGTDYYNISHHFTLCKHYLIAVRYSQAHLIQPLHVTHSHSQRSEYISSEEEAKLY